MAQPTASAAEAAAHWSESIDTRARRAIEPRASAEAH
jgi:hypothetical protein